MPEQIVFNKHTPQYVWDQLEMRSTETRISFAPQCPICHSLIHHTHRGLRCLGCDVPVSVFQQRYLTPNADERVIFIEVKGDIHEVLKLNLQCLSCEQTIKNDESCVNTCGIQTYLVLESNDSELNIKRWGNHPNVRRDIPEIPTRLHRQLPQHSDDVASEESSLTILDQVLALLDDGHERSTRDIVGSIDAHPTTIKKALKKASDTGLIIKVRHGYYQRPEAKQASESLLPTPSP